METALPFAVALSTSVTLAICALDSLVAEVTTASSSPRFAWSWRDRMHSSERHVDHSIHHAGSCAALEHHIQREMVARSRTFMSSR